MVEIITQIVSPDRPDAVGLIQELDAHLNPLYPPESRHGLNIAALMQPNIKFLVALADDEAVGCGGILFAEDYGEVKRMYVKPAWRGHGVGYRILESLEALARDAGLSLLRLETGIYQTEAIKLYERCGFQRCKPFANYTDDPVSLCYEKHLK